jgi:ribonuclease HI
VEEHKNEFTVFKRCICITTGGCGCIHERHVLISIGPSTLTGPVQLQDAGARILVTSPKGKHLKYVLQMHFLASNKATKYEALLHGLRIGRALGTYRLKVLEDSLLIINQANKEWSCLDDSMLLYFQELRKLENNFNGLEYLHILRGKKEVADELAKHGSSLVMVPTGVFLHKLHEPTISKALAKANKAAESSQGTPPLLDSKTESSEIMKIHSDWRTPFMI